MQGISWKLRIFCTYIQNVCPFWHPTIVLLGPSYCQVQGLRRLEAVFDVVDREGAAIEISRRLFLPSLLAYFPQDPAVWGLGDKSS